MDKISVSILIPVFNNLKYTQECLKRLDKSVKVTDSLVVHTIVIDDASTDGTYDWVKKNYPSHILLKGNGSLWWSGGINKGMKYAYEKLKSDYLLWWNNDIIHYDDFFGNLFEVLSKAGKNTIVGSKIYCGDNRELVWSMGGKFNEKTGKRYMTGFKETDHKKYSIKTEADWLPGMGTIFHYSVIEKIGYVDEKNFPQYHGDSDFTLRAKKAGFNIIVDPRLKIWNDVANSGQLHGETFKGLLKSFTSIKSKYNLKKDLQFFKRHARGIGAYGFLFREYFKYTGGFFKWKMLNLLSVKK